MLNELFNFWLGLGCFLIFAEFILPGLVSIFVGLGALTVALLMHYQIIGNLPEQLVTWFISSTVYIFTLRLVVIRLYPSDQEKVSIDEDLAMVGQIAEVIVPISRGHPGRILHNELTWNAILDGDEDILVGEKVRIIGRENISMKVRKIETEEK